MKKLSELIKEGMALTKEFKGDYAVVKPNGDVCACALGCALIAANGGQEFVDHMLNQVLDEALDSGREVDFDMYEEDLFIRLHELIGYDIVDLECGAEPNAFGNEVASMNDQQSRQDALEFVLQYEALNS